MFRNPNSLRHFWSEHLASRFWHFAAGNPSKTPKQPVESYRKSVSKIFKRKFAVLVVFHVKSRYAQEICVFEAFLRHFHFSTIIDNFSTF
jgi:hypothetical protein